MLVLLINTQRGPVLLLSVVLAFLLGKGIPNAAAVVAVQNVFPIVRSQTAQVKSELVEAARL